MSRPVSIPSRGMDTPKSTAAQLISGVSIPTLPIYIYYIFNGHNNLFHPMMVFLIGALLWPIMLYLNINKFLVILALFITSLGALMIMNKDTNIFTLLLVFHVIFTDNILWGYKFIKYKKLILNI